MVKGYEREQMYSMLIEHGLDVIGMKNYVPTDYFSLL
jgi:hypothetical protein